MLILNLDKEFKPFPAYKAEISFNLFEFSGGERSIKLLFPTAYTDDNRVLITHRIKNSSDLMDILLAKDALDHLGIKEVHLYIPYVPYARQDRICDRGESFSLKIFAKLINSANFTKVTILDAHSGVAPALINNCVNIPNTSLVKMALLVADCEIIISPDAGANSKINKLTPHLENITKVVKCDKQRNPATGELTGFEVFADNLQGQNCMIVDDICDGGGTFIGLARALKEKNAGDLYLFTTFGIYSKGLDTLSKYFDTIFCSDGFSTIKTDNKTLFQIKIINTVYNS